MGEAKLLTFDKILGLEKGAFIAVVVILVILGLAFLYFFFASVFVEKSDNKIVEKFFSKKNDGIKVLQPGWNLIIPLFDKVVAKISMTNKIFNSTKDIGFAAGENTYSLGYTLTYKVTNARQYYYAAKDFEPVFENRVAKALIAFLISSKITVAGDFYKIKSEKLLEALNNAVSEYGVQISEFTFITVK